MTYSLQDAVDVLDAVAAGFPPDRATIIHGAVALALLGPQDNPELVTVLIQLEAMVLGSPESLSDGDRQRAGHLASVLRRLIGVH
jgi:hypothetical protein